MLERVKIMKEAVVRRMEATQKSYKNNYNKKVHGEPQIHVGNGVHVYRPQHAAFMPNSAKAFAWKEYRKLIRRTCGLYIVTEAQPNTVLITKDSILNRVARDKVTPAQKSPEDTKQASSREK